MDQPIRICRVCNRDPLPASQCCELSVVRVKQCKFGRFGKIFVFPRLVFRERYSLDAPRSADEDSHPRDLPAEEMRIDEHLLERHRVELIQRAIASLPEKQRAAVLLHKYEEMDYAEIAKILNCTEAALRSLLFRAYENLRVQLGPLVNPPALQRAGERRPS